MHSAKKTLNQPVGSALPDWKPAIWPPLSPVDGQTCRIEPLDPKRHLDDLHEAFDNDSDGRLWTYMPVGPFASRETFASWLGTACRSEDPLFCALTERSTGIALGIAALMRIRPDIGVIEVGHITYSPRMQRTVMATEAMFLLMKRVFDELGYRRYEWKCDSLNAASRRAAERLGFRFEGVFEQATIYKGRNRDTAWYSIVDRDWPELKSAYVRWLDDKNFDVAGRQKHTLQSFIDTERTRASEEPV